MVPQEVWTRQQNIPQSSEAPTVGVARVLVVLQAGGQRVTRSHNGVLRQVLHKHLREWVQGRTGRDGRREMMGAGVS